MHLLISSYNYSILSYLAKFAAESTNYTLILQLCISSMSLNIVNVPHKCHKQYICQWQYHTAWLKIMYLLACNICAYVVSLEGELQILQICLYVVIVIKLSYAYACIDQLRVTFNQETLFTNVSLHFLNMQKYLIILEH